jgi:ribosomal protein L44E
MNKEERKEYMKQYRQDNKEIIKLQKREYNEKNKEKIKMWRKNWGEKNKEKEKEYREKNKDKINERQNIKVKCDLCGSTVLKRQLKRHQNTMKCKKHNEILFSDDD